MALLDYYDLFLLMNLGRLLSLVYLHYLVCRFFFGDLVLTVGLFFVSETLDNSLITWGYNTFYSSIIQF